MSDTNNYPGRPPLTDRLAPKTKAPTRAQRQREADNATVAGRVAELAADVEVMVQRARWSLTVKDAQDLAVILDDHSRYSTLDDGVHVSGDHRPHAHLDPDGHPARIGGRRRVS